MSRRHAAEKREVLPDPKYGSIDLTKFVNSLMYDGKKSIAEAIVYGALTKMEKMAGAESPIKLFMDALARVSPKVEVRSRRVGGATYQVPVPVSDTRAKALSIRWLINAARKRPEKTMVERLFGELRDALEGRGAAVKKCEETHRMAEANRAFSHYRW